MAAMDDDWVVVADEEWILLAGDEGTMSAVFFGRLAVGIGGGISSPIPIVGPAIATAGSAGLVLFSGAWCRDHVLDPSTGARHALPLPNRPRSSNAAIARNDVDGYSVVRASEDCFEIYSSATGAWREVPAPAAAAGILAGSAASFAGHVFWKTKTASSCGVLALDVASGAPRHIGPPPRSASALWQLGVAAGHLCAAVCIGNTLDLYGLADGDEWKLLHAISGLVLDDDESAPPRPLRFESDNHEVLLRSGGRVVALDIVNGTTREARLDAGAVLPERDDDIVPWCRPVSTLLL